MCIAWTIFPYTFSLTSHISAEYALHSKIKFNDSDNYRPLLINF
jgi:hypothetical protein